MKLRLKTIFAILLCAIVFYLAGPFGHCRVVHQPKTVNCKP